MFDRDSLLVSYRAGAASRAARIKRGQSWEGSGDCIDCRQCVAVCPTGIDIRNGSQLECIQCALCIDACNEIMDKVGRPRGLIAYDTVRNLESPGTESFPQSVAPPRGPLCHARSPSSASIMLTALMLRPELDVNVLHDRNPLYVQLSDGGFATATPSSSSTSPTEPRAFRIGVSGLPGAKLNLVGQEKERRSRRHRAARRSSVAQALCDARQEPRPALPEASTEFSFVVIAIDARPARSTATTFQGPER